MALKVIFLIRLREMFNTRLLLRKQIKILFIKETSKQKFHHLEDNRFNQFINISHNFIIKQIQNGDLLSWN